MTSTGLRISTSKLAPFWLLGLACILNAPHLGATEQPTQKQLDQIRQNIGTLKQDLGGDKKKSQQYQQELGKLEKEIATLSRKQRDSGKALKKQQQAQQQLLGETAALRRRLNQQQEKLALQIRAGYGSDQQATLKMLLNQTDPGSIGRSMIYHGYFSRARLDAVEQMRKEITQLDTAEIRLKQTSAELEKLQADLARQSNELKQRQSQRKNVLAKLNDEIDSKEQRLKRLQEDEKSLGKLLNELASKGNLPKGAIDLTQYKGKLKWPTQGTLLNRFGASRSQGLLSWQGVTISGKEGQDIRAVAPGRIIFADWMRGYGLLLIIDHGNGYMSLYGQNQSLYKNVGDRVSANDVIAALGNSGGNSDNSLYFEMRHKGKPVDPATWCR